MLDAGWCRQLGDADVRALVAASGRRLARVRLDCTRVGDSGACMLASRCPHLAALSLAACTSILGLSAYLFSTGAPPGAEAATLWVAGGGAWWALDRTRLGLALAALTAAAAPTSELVLMQVVGLWHYAAPDWFPLGPSVPGLPSWVPACYFAYATWVGCVARALAAWGRCDG